MIQVFMVCTGWCITFFNGIKRLIPSLIIGVSVFLFSLVYFLVNGSNAVEDFIEILMLLTYAVITVACLYMFRQVVTSLGQYLSDEVVNRLTEGER